MASRRTFIKNASMATLAMATMPTVPILAGGAGKGRTARRGKGMTLTFEPYELKLRHVFTVATNSRSTTPDIQVRLDYDGVVGYGEASMPP